MESEKAQLKRRSTDNGNYQSKVQKILYNQVTFIIAIVSIAFAIYYTFANPQRQTEQILLGVESKLNIHEKVQEQYQVTVAEALKLIKEGDLVDLKRDILENRNEINRLNESIVKLQTIIEERIPIKK